MLATGEFVSVERLHAYGFINYLEESPDSVRSRALRTAQAIEANAPLSVQAAKASVLAGSCVGAEKGLEEADEIYRKVYASSDAQEGMRAFVEGRPPRWTNS